MACNNTLGVSLMTAVPTDTAVPKLRLDTARAGPADSRRLQCQCCGLALGIDRRSWIIGIDRRSWIIVRVGETEARNLNGGDKRAGSES